MRMETGEKPVLTKRNGVFEIRGGVYYIQLIKRIKVIFYCLRMLMSM